MKKLICKNCSHSETLEKINGSAITKILIAPYPRQREEDGLHIYPLYCLICNYITEWATDIENISKDSIDGVEYFKSFKIKFYLNVCRSIDLVYKKYYVRKNECPGTSRASRRTASKTDKMPVRSSDSIVKPS